MKSITSKVAPLATAVSILIAAASLQAANGVLIVEHVTSGGNTRTTEMQLEKTRMRVDLSGTQFMVFDGVKQVLDMINTDKKTYIEMTKADLERLASQMQGASARMQAQLEKMPPAQRKQMEALMKDRAWGRRRPRRNTRGRASDKSASGPATSTKVSRTDKKSPSCARSIRGRSA